LENYVLLKIGNILNEILNFFFLFFFLIKKSPNEKRKL